MACNQRYLHVLYYYILSTLPVIHAIGLRLTDAKRHSFCVHMHVHDCVAIIAITI